MQSLPYRDGALPSIPNAVPGPHGFADNFQNSLRASQLASRNGNFMYLFTNSTEVYNRREDPLPFRDACKYRTHKDGCTCYRVVGSIIVDQQDGPDDAFLQMYDFSRFTPDGSSIPRCSNWDRTRGLDSEFVYWPPMEPHLRSRANKSILANSKNVAIKWQFPDKKEDSNMKYGTAIINESELISEWLDWILVGVFDLVLDCVIALHCLDRKKLRREIEAGHIQAGPYFEEPAKSVSLPSVHDQLEVCLNCQFNENYAKWDGADRWRGTAQPEILDLG